MTKLHRGFVIVDRPIHTNGLNRVIDFVESGLTNFVVIQVPAGMLHRMAITRWFQRNSPASKYLKVNGHWDRDTWLMAFPDVHTAKEFRTFMHNKRQHFLVWQGDCSTNFIDEAARTLELAKIDGRVEGGRRG